MNKRKKVCLISSTGGHLSQLRQLVPIVKNENFYFVTEQHTSTEALKEKYNVYYLTQQDRKNINFVFVFLFNILYSLFIVLKERPTLIISTGAGAVLPTCILGKLLGSKILFIESFAKIDTPTITGRIIYKFADRFYIQWEELKKHYPKAKYKGAIY
ncbi:UDP-N-acetylglucosamine:LPS N-acetylglucosamine transferase [Neobacillus niacini]|uniref:PssD/Cps14F family polysaccharide biosynthesis glycosyltransferase n=1 Tax=Neobacillus niacini TaxID=86668 RepID=UPI00286460E9|nr:PssD/Cps14F family polysaccharide biosynthesis glycosyltransferase [Neobacillus niacini]MDR7078851.1 UDP-N-acetylglucosamine:LPS N-acetylglucosamine transferase [Neobacillus niacini]